MILLTTEPIEFFIVEILHISSGMVLGYFIWFILDYFRSFPPLDARGTSCNI